MVLQPAPLKRGNQFAQYGYFNDYYDINMTIRVIISLYQTTKGRQGKSHAVNHL
jgi:hypothetical protein